MLYTKKFVLKQEKENCILRKGQTVQYKINSNEFDITGVHRLLFSCEDSSCPTMKNESGAELLYMLIDDSLNYEKAKKTDIALICHVKNPYPLQREF